jgi:hypothetical protein
MPDFVTVIGVDAPARMKRLLGEHGLCVGETEHTMRTLREALESVQGDLPDARIRVLYHGTAAWALFGVLTASGGVVEEDFVSWSLEEDAWSESKAKPATEVRVPLTVEADTLVDLLVDASDERGEPEARGRDLVLPPELGEHPKARRALAQVAARLKPKQVQVQLDIHGDFYEATLERGKGVTLVPLHAWLDDEDARRFVRSVLGTPAPGGFEPCQDGPVQVAPKRDPKQPLTTGSLKARVESSYDAAGDIARLDQAVRAPENAGAAFAPLRRNLYELLGECEPARALPVLLSGLDREEDEAVRGELYSILSKVDAEPAHRALARGFKVEPPGVLERLSQVLWRQRGAVEVLVREHLVPAWSSDRGYADRIVRLLRDEYVEVHPAWLPDAPEALRKALAPVLVRE